MSTHISAQLFYGYVIDTKNHSEEVEKLGEISEDIEITTSIIRKEKPEKIIVGIKISETETPGTESITPEQMINKIRKVESTEAARKIEEKMTSKDIEPSLIIAGVEKQ